MDGVYRHVDSLIRYCFKLGLEVHLAYSSKRSCPGLFQLVEEVERRGGKTLDLRVSNAPVLGDIPALARLYSLAREVNPDVIHCHSSKAGVLGRTLSFLGIKASYFYSPHAYYGLARQHSVLAPFYNWVEAAFGRCGHTINCSEDERQFAINRLHIDPDKCVGLDILPVDTRVFRPATPEEKRLQRKKLGLPEKAVVLGSMGRITFQKDPETLYRAFGLARKRGLDLYLLHAGRGDAELEKRLEDLAESLGFKDRLVRVPYYETPSEFYSAIDGMIMTSRYEGGWPNVLLEALASNLPVISGVGSGTSDLPKAGLSHCWTAATGDVEGFAQAIGAWHQDRARQRKFNHRDLVMVRFTADVCLGRIAEHYSASIGHGELRPVPASA